MAAAIGTIPYFSTYQPGALPIASTVYIEIVDSLSATSAQSWNQSQIDFVGKAPAIIPNANPVASDRFAFFQVATGLPKACTLGNFGVPFGNVPTGGSAGYVLVKNSATNYDASWTSILSGSVLGLRSKLSATTTYYVRAAGNDSNNGTSALTAFATVQKSLDVIENEIDFNGHAVTLDLGPGAWSGGPYYVNNVVGMTYGGQMLIKGAGSALTSISLWGGLSGNFSIQDLSIDASLGDATNGMYIGEYCEVGVGTDVAFITTGGFAHVYCYDQGALSVAANIKISGNNNAFFFGDFSARYHTLSGGAVTLVGNPDFSTGFFWLRDHAQVDWAGATKSGACTGPQWAIEGSGAGINANGFTTANIPGSLPGTYGADPVDVGSLITELASATTFAFGGTTSVSGRFGVTGTAAFTGTFGIVGTTLVTGTLGAVGTAAFTGVHGIVGTTLVTGVFGIVGTSNLTGLLNVVGGISSPSPTDGIGYGLGAGSATTQTVSKATGVTLNTVSGQITTHSASLAGGASVFFIVTNSNVGLSDVPFLAVQSAATSANYRATPARIVTGSFGVVLSNLSTGALTDAVVLNFVLFKGVAA